MPVNIGLCLTAIWREKKKGISTKDYMGLFRGEHIDFPDKKALYYSDLSQGELWQRQQAHLSAWVARARRLVERLSEREESLFTAAMTRQPCWAGNAGPWTLLLLTRTKRTSQPQTGCQCDKYGFTAQKFTRGQSVFKRKRQTIWDREVEQRRALMKACSDWVTNVSCLSDITAYGGRLKYPACIHLGIKINTNWRMSTPHRWNCWLSLSLTNWSIWQTKTQTRLVYLRFKRREMQEWRKGQQRREQGKRERHDKSKERHGWLV